LAINRPGPATVPPRPPVGSSVNRYGLNALNFFTAAVQTGFGAYVAVWLTQQGWSQTAVGIALSIGTAAGLIGQLPGGALIDAVHRKRNTAAVALVVVAVSALLLAAPANRITIWGAQILHALASCVITPAIAAITLSLVGHAGFSEQLGANTRYASLGNGVAAAGLGAVAYLMSERGVFVTTALLALPTLAALYAIREADRLPPDDEHPALLHPKDRKEWPWHIFSEPALHVFAICTVLFHLSNAAMLPLALNMLTRRGEANGIIVSAAIVVPQVIMAALAPWAGSVAQRVGRRSVLLVGFLALPARALLFATGPGAVPLVVIQTLDAVSGIMFGLMPPLIAADLTRRNGYLNLAIGSLGLAAGLGATFSTILAGWMADRFGADAAFIGLAAAGAAAWAICFIAMPETRPGQIPHTHRPAMVL
jgi:MFS family permease